MKCLITGGAGFIGSHLAEELVQESISVIVIDNLSTGQIENIEQLQSKKDFKFFNADLREKEKIEKIFLNEKPDYVFHLAAQMNVRESVKNPVYDAEVNIIGLLNLLEASKKSQIKKFIFSSSGGVVYGDDAVIPTSETEKTQPICPYGVAKLSSEKYLFFYTKEYGLKYVTLRYANVYGPRQNSKGEAGVVSIFIDKIIKKEQPTIYGTGNQTRDYVYVKDVVNANVLAFKKNLNGIFNVGTGKETSVNELFEKINSLMKSNFNKIYGPQLSGEQLRSCLSYEKIKSACGWEPKFDVDTGLKETIEYFKTKRL